MSKTGGVKDFDKLLTAFIEVANRSVANLEQQNADLTSTVSTLLTENNELRNELKQINKRLQLNEGMVAQMRSKMIQQDEKILDLMARSMRDNIVIQGIQEKPNETWDDTKKSLHQFFVHEMKIPNPDDIIIERAHRSGPKQNGLNAKPRPIIAKLDNQTSKDIIFKNVKSLAGKKQYSIQDQLPAEVNERRKRLWQKYKNAKSDANNTVKWNLDKLVINGVTHSAHDDEKEIDPSIVTETELDIKHTQHEIVDGSTFMGHSAKITNKDHK